MLPYACHEDLGSYQTSLLHNIIEKNHACFALSYPMNTIMSNIKGRDIIILPPITLPLKFSNDYFLPT